MNPDGGGHRCGRVMPCHQVPSAATACARPGCWVVILGAVLAIGWLLTHPLESTVDPWDDDVARWFAGERTRRPERRRGRRDVARRDHRRHGRRRRRRRRALVVAALLRAGDLRRAARRRDRRLLLGGDELISRDRPPVRILDPGLVPDHSFPSGHVATATAVYGGIAVLIWVLAPAARPWVWLLFLLPAVRGARPAVPGRAPLTDELASVPTRPPGWRSWSPSCCAGPAGQ